MDFWSRLVGTGFRPRNGAPNPEQRLARFKKLYHQVLNTSDRYPSILSDLAAAENLQIYFTRIASILTEETKSPAPHLCIAYAASARIYTVVSQIASASDNEALIGSAVLLFSALLESEEEEFPATKEFAEALTFFTTSITGSGKIGENTEAQMVELLFNIAAKIRLQPEVLPVWFTSNTLTRRTSHHSGRNQYANFAGLRQTDDFPLCYQLIDYVHHGGRIGDFARTALLYIFESAARSQALEVWLVESDLPTLMATGLGALYSQLSRKLSILHPKDHLPFILALSDYEELDQYSDAENMFAPHFQVHIETFLSYLLFWQDVMEHCHSVDVRATLKDHFRVLFLQQLLYPSLLESSDVDGGSSVAVLTYLRFILDSLDHPELVHMILQYLLALPAERESAQPPKSPTALRRRMSLMLLSAMNEGVENPDPNLFSMVDLVHSGIESYNRQTVTSALKLVTIMFTKDHSYALGTLFRTQPMTVKEPQRTHGALTLELEQYTSVAQAVGGSSGTEEAYDKHLKDASTSLETHACAVNMLGLNKLNVPNDIRQEIESMTAAAEGVSPHRVASNDRLTHLMLNVLRDFVINDVETNLSLTEALVTIASCPYFYLDGWMTIDPETYVFQDAEVRAGGMPSEALQSVRRARQRPILTDENTPPLLRALQQLETQIEILKADVPDFDRLIESRKQAFLISDQMDNATYAAPKKKETERPADRPQTSAEVMSFSRGRQPNAFSSSAAGSSMDPSRSRSPMQHSSRGASSSGAHSSPAPLDRILQAAAANITNALNVPDRPSPLQQQYLQQHYQQPLPQQQQPQQQQPPSAQSITVADVEAGLGGILHKKVKVPLIKVSSDGSGQEGVESAEAKDLEAQVSLTHVLTNVVILQEFILEITAILQVRATLFAEVKFS